MTNRVWYSDPRGCSTPLASISQPGCASTSSRIRRPGTAGNAPWISRAPIAKVTPVRAVSTSGGSLVTVTSDETAASDSWMVSVRGTAVRTSTPVDAGTKPLCSTMRRKAPKGRSWSANLPFASVAKVRDSCGASLVSVPVAASGNPVWSVTVSLISPRSTCAPASPADVAPSTPASARQRRIRPIRLTFLGQACCGDRSQVVLAVTVRDRVVHATGNRRKGHERLVPRSIQHQPHVLARHRQLEAGAEIAVGDLLRPGAECACGVEPAEDADRVLWRHTEVLCHGKDVR